MCWRGWTGPGWARGARRLLLAGLAAIGCAPAADPSLRHQPSYDLVYSLPAAVAVEAILRVDVGTEDARALLGTGWSWNETAGDGSTFVWGVGAESHLSLPLNGYRPTELRFRAQPREQPEVPGRGLELSIEVEGTVLEPVALSPTDDTPGGFRQYRIAVDPAIWSPTDSLIRLRYRPEPTPSSPEDRRRLAVAWDWFEVGGPSIDRRVPSITATAKAAGGRLRLPAGRRLDYLVDLERGSRLAFDGIRPSLRALLVVLSPRGERPRTLVVAPDLALDLGVDRFTVATLSLIANPEALEEGEHLALEAPRIERPAD